MPANAEGSPGARPRRGRRERPEAGADQRQEQQPDDPTKDPGAAVRRRIGRAQEQASKLGQRTDQVARFSRRARGERVGGRGRNRQQPLLSQPRTANRKEQGEAPVPIPASPASQPESGQKIAETSARPLPQPEAAPAQKPAGTEAPRSRNEGSLPDDLASYAYNIIDTRPGKHGSMGIALANHTTPETIAAVAQEIRDLLILAGVNPDGEQPQRDPFMTLYTDLHEQLPKRLKLIEEERNKTQALLDDTDQWSRTSYDVDDAAYQTRIDGITSRMYDMSGDQAKQLVKLCKDRPDITHITLRAHFTKEVGAAFAAYPKPVILTGLRTLNADLAAGLAARGSGPVIFAEQVSAVDKTPVYATDPRVPNRFRQASPSPADLGQVRDLTLREPISFEQQKDLFPDLANVGGTLTIRLDQALPSVRYLAAFKGEKLVITVDKPYDDPKEWERYKREEAKRNASQEALFDELVAKNGRQIRPPVENKPDPMIRYNEDVAELERTMRIYANPNTVVTINGKEVKGRTPLNF